MKIWLDDVREPPDDTWEWCKTGDELKNTFLLLAIYGEIPEVVSFDHDLGEDSPDGYDLIKWIVNTHPDLYPQEVLVHSANVPGAMNIREYDRNWRKFRDSYARWEDEHPGE